jgi:hypothetical protein
MHIYLGMNELRKTQGGFDGKKRTQIGLRMGSFPARMGSVWVFSKLRAGQRRWEGYPDCFELTCERPVAVIPRGKQGL